MKDIHFDELTRSVGGRSQSRRTFLAACVATSAAFVSAWTGSSAGNRRQRRRKRRGSITVCFKGVQLSVPIVAASRLLRRGAQLGACGQHGGLPPGGGSSDGSQTCENATLPCDVRLTTCGGANSDCFCFITTLGASFCAGNGIQCRPGTTCITDGDCPDGYACVPTLGCGGVIPCSDSSNACAPPCQG